MIKTRKAIEEFVDTKTCHEASRMHSEDNKLFNFETVIAQWFGDTLAINNTYYSRTTTKHQNELICQAKSKNIHYFLALDVMKGTKDLTHLYKRHVGY